MKNLILLHGWAADGRIWEHQRAALASRVQIWAPTLPVWDAAWLGAKLQAFDPAQTILVGWSLGGMLALEVSAAGFHPQGLITLAAGASFCRRPDYALGVAPAVVRAMRQRLRQAPESVVQEFYQQLSAPGETSAQDDLSSLLPAQLEPEWLAAGLAYLLRQDLRPLLPQVRAGAQVIVHGERDRITAAAQSYFLREQLPAARLVLLPGAGHAPMVSCRQIINDLIADFL